MAVPENTIPETYSRDGFVFPIDAIDADEAHAVRADLEAAEAELADQSEKIALLRSYPDRLLPSFDGLIRNENLISAVSQVLGADLMVWSAGLFIKEANSPKIVSWHQDLTYWGLDDVEETTCWVALSCPRPYRKRLHEIRPRQPQETGGSARGHLRREQSADPRSGSCRRC